MFKNLTLNYKGTVQNFGDLPVDNNEVGDYYIVRSDGNEYFWPAENADGSLAAWSLIKAKLSDLDPLVQELEFAFKRGYLINYTEYTYDDGDLTDIDIYTDDTKTKKLFNKSIEYDVDGQLIKLILTRIDDGTTLTKEFTYDVEGNFKSTRRS